MPNPNPKVIDGLSGLLADSYLLYLKTHNFHWNVTGPQFSQLHLLFEGQYTELATAVDEIAERIRALGKPAPGTFREFSSLTKVKEPDGVPPANDMIRMLMEDQNTLAARARSVVDAAGDEDPVSADLGTRRAEVHEKNAWMLRSLLE